MHSELGRTSRAVPWAQELVGYFYATHWQSSTIWLGSLQPDGKLQNTSSWLGLCICVMSLGFCSSRDSGPSSALNTGVNPEGCHRNALTWLESLWIYITVPHTRIWLRVYHLLFPYWKSPHFYNRNAISQLHCENLGRYFYHPACFDSRHLLIQTEITGWITHCPQFHVCSCSRA